MNVRTKSEVVLHTAGNIGENGRVRFIYDPMCWPPGVWDIELNPNDWEDMGSPETITVTIEPGDRLNAKETVA